MEKANARLEAENADLREKLRKAQQAEKRQAAPFSKGAPKADPKKPGRKAGDNYGKKGHRRPPEDIDEVMDAPLPGCCPDCGGGIEWLEVKEQFQDEILRRPIRRRFKVHIGRCCCCRRRVQGRHPLQTSDALGAAASQIGPDASALMVMLNKEAGLSYGKIARVMEVAFGLAVSRGASAQAVLRAGRRCSAAYADILTTVREQGEVAGDETGWRVGGRCGWLWVFATDAATAYRIASSRGHDVIEAVLGPDYQGKLVHDGWAPYDCIQWATHQQCLAHILRRCRTLLEIARGPAASFPKAIKALLQRAIGLRDRRDARQISDHGLRVAIGQIECQLDALLEWTRDNKANERFAKHLHAHRDQLLAFLRHPGLAATNWRAEQAIRPAVVNRKVWGGNRTHAGARAQETILSVLRTCAQRGIDALAFLSRAFRTPGGSEPRLLPARAT